MITSSALPSHINMEVTLSCPGANYDSMNDTLGAFIMRSISFGEEATSTMRSISFNGKNSESSVFKAFRPRKLLIQGSVSFNGRQINPFHLETKLSMNPAPEPDKSTSSRFSLLKKRSLESTLDGPDSPKHEAALKLQKVYKSFRTRRQLADCAVVVEQRWWKLLDFALLKLSSVSFFDFEKQESAVSRWSRARTRAAKVGKGLSKNEKAQKLALQHWLEAIDPRHRYGHNLQFYYDCWLQCENMQPFFYWLDVGEGKDVNLEEQCPRWKLQQQCIKYLGPKEREAYEVIIEDGKFMYKQSRQLINTSDGPKNAKWIFVLSTSKNLYVGQKKKGTFQHSSFLAGGATSAAGQLIVENGYLKAVWPHSGHYRPTAENFQEFMSFLEENNVDLTDVKKSPTGEDDQQLYSGLGTSGSELDLAEKNISINPKTSKDLSRSFSGKMSNDSATEPFLFDLANISCSLTDIKLGGEEHAKGSLDVEQHCKFHRQIIIEDHEESEEDIDVEIGSVKEPAKNNAAEEGENSSDSEQQCYIFQKKNLFTEDQEEDEEPSVPSELILRRINSKKGIKSYQLGKRLSFKWTTGAGPRIVCVRDYPSELQFRALEQVNLSPRSGAGMSRFASPRTAQSSATQESFLQNELQQQPQEPGNVRNVRRRNQSL